MKVLMQARPDLLKIPAGDTIQILKTKAALEGLGVEVDINLTINPDLTAYQLVHCFNIIRVEETYAQVQNAIEQQCPVVLTPIYWNMKEYLEKTSPEKLNWWYKGMDKRKEVLKMAHVLLPNARSEMFQLKMDFKCNTPYQIVYNGVDPSFYESSPKLFIQKYGLKNFVLCVGRISPRKNQLTMIRALKGTDLKMVFIGSINDPRYYRQCLKEGGDQVLFISHLPQNRLASAYAAARVHMLASWYDTPGLVNLEAGLAGCNLVVSDRGTAREYFGDLVWYCSPDDPHSIRMAVLEAFFSPQIDDLKSYILRHFTWEETGKATFEAYLKLLNSRY
ncbi:hypothetical protein BBF96_14255 [Anoxybacter fermentans]|uniref:Glycosyl transferase family 1 domain-containing protein n=1 Tax=Anoxybacter fermentans TaxID=1323375 RepID=A0A3Q9HSL4_9FIRM|nr:glycosyltransferase [Anoxybacter fermentans]AZR74447.1 hypothetical protein BBF96_14255 [Anoxybacter fermentans]